MNTNYDRLQQAAIFIVGCLLLFGGCQTTPSTDAGKPGASTEVAALRTAFTSAPELSDRLERLTDLESQALQLADDEPLKLGSLGTAILDLYYGSLTGHYVMQRFYDHVENADTAAHHAVWIDKIRTDMATQAKGTADSPYPAITTIEPLAYARTLRLIPVGSIYRTNGDTPFALLMLARPKTGNLKSLHFDLATLYQASEEKLKKEDQEFTPFELMAHLARRGDTAAQAAIGAYLASHDRYDDAAGWLRASSRSGNVLANNLLARVFWEQSNLAKNDDTRQAALDQVLENYMHAIALGSTDAAYALSVLYLNEHYGKDNVAAGFPLLQQAVDAEHVGAILYNAHLQYAGEMVPKDVAAAEAHYRRAAELQSPAAQRAYARFLLDRDLSSEPHEDTIVWLEKLADKKDPDAMLLLGNLNARGIGTRNNPRRAIRWFEKAIAASSEDANIVNEVAWTLAVTDQKRLKRGKYALTIMSDLMENDERARSKAAYLDTWAATYAANNQFDRAVEVQSEALAKAKEQEQADVIEELEAHLEDFKAGRPLTQPVP